MNRTEQKKIVFNVSNIRNWMGGVYYAYNIVNLIMSSDKLRSLYEIHVVVAPCNAHIFRKYGKNIKLVELDYNNCYLNSVYLIWYMHRYKIDYWYALSLDIVDIIIAKRAIYWIADFQHLYLPQYFSRFELKLREGTVRYIANRKNMLILSSEDAKKTFITKYKKYNCKCKVVHFASDIINEVRQITEVDEIGVLKKYGLESKRYIYIPNQFWQHKNHIIVLKMIEQLVIKGKNDVIFVFTGQMSDYRSKNYTEKIKEYFAREDITRVTKNLGFIERKEQIIIMKNALFLIQPSLFEGWGTVLEDAKVLDKRVILSDLRVHEEQKYEKCSLFRRDDAFDLLDKVEQLINEKSEDDLEKGFERFRRDSKKYAEELEKVLI